MSYANLVSLNSLWTLSDRKFHSTPEQTIRNPG